MQKTDGQVLSILRNPAYSMYFNSPVPTISLTAIFLVKNETLCVKASKQSLDPQDAPNEHIQA